MRGPWDGGSRGSYSKAPTQNSAVDTDTTLKPEYLQVLKRNMYLGDRPDSTCRTSNRMVVGQRLPSIAILLHAPPP